MNRRWQRHALLLTSLVAACGCGAGDWKSRLQERFDAQQLEHPLTAKANQAHKRALAAEAADRDDDATLWALAADRFLSAAIVRVRSAKLQRENEVFRKELVALREEVHTLEANVASQFEQSKELARQQWLEEAKMAAYAAAEEYEARRFRKRNEESAPLKQAQEELLTLARLQLEGTRALDRRRSFDELADALAQCAKQRDPIIALDCVTKVRWQIQERFSEARRRHGLSADDTAHVKAELKNKHLTVRWQNDALALVADTLTIPTLRFILSQAKGPVQAHGPRPGLARVRRKLGRAGASDKRIATPVEDDGEQTVLYLLAYPRIESHSGPGSD